MTSAGPILLFGMPRSGTTWLGKLFDSHPDTLYRHEPDSVHRLNMPLYPDVADSDLYRLMLDEFVSALPHMREPKIVAKQPIFPKAYLSLLTLTAYKAGVAFAKVGKPQVLTKSVWFTPSAENFAQRRLVWKSIESLGRLGVCVSALRQARAVFILRHPCGYVASVLRGEADKRFMSRTPSSEDYGIFAQLLETEPAKAHAIKADDLHSMSPDERLAWRWVLTCEKALQDTKNCERVLMVRYEELCANPFDWVARMFQFSGLAWSPQTARFIEASTATVEGNYYSVFHDPAKAANRWRSELPAEVIARVENILRNSFLCALYEHDVLRRTR